MLVPFIGLCAKLARLRANAQLMRAKFVICVRSHSRCVRNPRFACVRTQIEDSEIFGA